MRYGTHHHRIGCIGKEKIGHCLYDQIVVTTSLHSARSGHSTEEPLTESISVAFHLQTKVGNHFVHLGFQPFALSPPCLTCPAVICPLIFSLLFRIAARCNFPSEEV